MAMDVTRSQAQTALTLPDSPLNSGLTWPTATWNKSPLGWQMC
uniref:Glucokinase n=1 Tax=Homo sapiens TaxID=9606 RepID=A0A8C8KJG0_HUMAN